MQTGDQKRDIAAVFFADLFVQINQRLDCAFAERKNRLDQFVGDFLWIAPDDVNEKRERIGRFEMPQQIDQQRIQIDAFGIVR